MNGLKQCPYDRLASLVDMYNSGELKEKLEIELAS